jgi:hypothetical protein
LSTCRTELSEGRRPLPGEEGPAKRAHGRSDRISPTSDTCASCERSCDAEARGWCGASAAAPVCGRQWSVEWSESPHVDVVLRYRHGVYNRIKYKNAVRINRCDGPTHRIGDEIANRYRMLRHMRNPIPDDIKITEHAVHEYHDLADKIETRRRTKRCAPDPPSRVRRRRGPSCRVSRVGCRVCRLVRGLTAVRAESAVRAWHGPSAVMAKIGGRANAQAISPIFRTQYSLAAFPFTRRGWP